MTTEALSRLQSTRPFQPFSIRLGDGQALPLEHHSRTATVYTADGDFQIVDLLLIAGLEVTTRKANGGRRKDSSR